jgi:hypothetical protein
MSEKSFTEKWTEYMEKQAQDFVGQREKLCAKLQSEGVDLECVVEYPDHVAPFMHTIFDVQNKRGYIVLPMGITEGCNEDRIKRLLRDNFDELPKKLQDCARGWCES